MSGLIARALTGAVLIFVILALRGLLHAKLPKRTFRALWIIALLHLLLPRLPYSPLSLYNLGEWLGSGDAVPVSAQAGKILGLPVVPGEENAMLPIAHDTSMLPLLWAVGVLLCAAWFLLAYVRTCRRFRDAEPVSHAFAEQWQVRRPIRLRQSGEITAPLAYGLLRPTILLPSVMERQDADTLRWVLLHEQLHLCRGDLWLKAGLAAAASIYWFSPLSWLMLHMANRDIELACDEAVLARLGEARRRDYAMALIRMEECRAVWAPLASGFAQSALEARITAIMKAKKITKTAWAVAIVLCLCVTIGLAATGEGTREEYRPEEKIAHEPQEGHTDEAVDIDAQLQTIIEPEPEKETMGKPTYDPEAEPAPEVWYWPVPSSNNITCRFGARIHPVTGEKMIYDHITIAAEKDILAAQSGKVMDVFFDSYSGNTVVIEHIGYVTMYGHLAEVDVRVGQYVEGGAVIGTAGRTGQATGDCLAFWVSKNGTTVDPLQFYNIEPKFTTGKAVSLNKQ